MQNQNLIIRVATASDKVYSKTITDEMAASAAARGTGIARRTPDYIEQKIDEGKAVIALTDQNEWVGFCYIETCAAALAVLEVIEEEKLMGNAVMVGKYLRDELSSIRGLRNVRGRGLMIGFDVDEDWKDLRKNLLWNQKVFTGEAKPNIIRLLPSLALKKKDAEQFIDSIKEEIEILVSADQA